jgi:hypothetical protein
MHLNVAVAVAVAIGIVVVGGWLGTPLAVADDMNCVPREGCNFFSPSGNIGCSLSAAAPHGSAALAYCGTSSPPQSVVMDEYGSPSFFPCAGDSCMNGLTPDTPTLAYGQTARQGPFTCVSDTSGLTCTAPSGRGIAISRSGIAAVG